MWRGYRVVVVADEPAPDPISQTIVGVFARVGPVRAPTKSEAAYAEVRSRILDGSLPPGCALNQEALAAALAISVTPLREALRRLEGEGLVQTRPDKMDIVAPLSSREIQELRYVRNLLEPEAASLAARNSDRAARARVVPLSDLTHTAAPPAWHSAHRLFHDAVWDLAGNLVLAEALRTLWARMDRYRRLAVRPEDFVRMADVEHTGIARAIAAGDAELAARLMADHSSPVVSLDQVDGAPAEG
jgi:DNA-binding GntR family transcriptional regulator